MEGFKLTKSCVFTICSMLLAVLMLLCPFFYGDTVFEYMEDLEFPGLLLWVYYVTFSITLIFSIIQKRNFSKLFSIINLAVIGLNILIVIIDHGDGNFFEKMGIGMYGCLAASVIAMISILRDIKKNPDTVQ